MCGRAKCSLSSDNMEQVVVNAGFPRTEWRQKILFKPMENISPGNGIPVLYEDTDKKISLRTMIWGLIPSFTEPDTSPNYYRMFNARSENLKDRKSFNRIIEKRRCVAIIEGYYEWKIEVGKKQPYYLYFADNRPMKVAGIFDIWESSKYKNDEEQKLFYSFSMLTTSSCNSIQLIHRRQPVILTDELAKEWIATGPCTDELLTKIRLPYSEPDFVYHPVHPRMSKDSYQGKDCTKPYQLFTSISKFFMNVSGVKPSSSPTSSQISVKTDDGFSTQSSILTSSSEAATSGRDSTSSSASLSISTNSSLFDQKLSPPRLLLCTASSPSPAQIKVVCPVCDQDITSMDFNARNTHAYHCLGVVSNATTHATLHSPSTATAATVTAAYTGNTESSSKRSLLTMLQAGQKRTGGTSGGSNSLTNLGSASQSADGPRKKSKWQPTQPNKKPHGLEGVS